MLEEERTDLSNRPSKLKVPDYSTKEGSRKNPKGPSKQLLEALPIPTKAVPYGELGFLFHGEGITTTLPGRVVVPIFNFTITLDVSTTAKFGARTDKADFHYDVPLEPLQFLSTATLTHGTVEVLRVNLIFDLTPLGHDMWQVSWNTYLRYGVDEQTPSSIAAFLKEISKSLKEEHGQDNIELLQPAAGELAEIVANQTSLSGARAVERAFDETHPHEDSGLSQLKSKFAELEATVDSLMKKDREVFGGRTRLDILEENRALSQALGDAVQLLEEIQVTTEAWEQGWLARGGKGEQDA